MKDTAQALRLFMPPYLARQPVEAGRAEPVLPRQLSDRHARVGLLDESDDLLVVKRLFFMSVLDG